MNPIIPLVKYGEISARIAKNELVNKLNSLNTDFRSFVKTEGEERIDSAKKLADDIHGLVKEFENYAEDFDTETDSSIEDYEDNLFLPLDEDDVNGDFDTKDDVFQETPSVDDVEDPLENIELKNPFSKFNDEYFKSVYDNLLKAESVDDVVNIVNNVIKDLIDTLADYLKDIFCIKNIED